MRAPIRLPELSPPERLLLGMWLAPHWPHHARVKTRGYISSIAAEAGIPVTAEKSLYHDILAALDSSSHFSPDRKHFRYLSQRGVSQAQAGRVYAALVRSAGMPRTIDGLARESALNATYVEEVLGALWLAGVLDYRQTPPDLHTYALVAGAEPDLWGLRED